MTPGHTAEVTFVRGCEARMNVNVVSMRRASGEMAMMTGSKSATGARIRVMRVRMRVER